MNYILTKIIEISLSKTINAFEDDIIHQIQGIGFVKNGNNQLQRIHISLELYNNKSFAVIQNVKLIYNEFELFPKQQFKFISKNVVDSHKPFHEFILGEKSVKELNIEFESSQPIELDYNNNVKIIFEKKDSDDQYEIEFGILLDEDTINLIRNSPSNGKPQIFRCDHFNIGE